MDVYYLEKRLETTLKRVNCAKNKDTLMDFFRYCVASGLSKGTISRQLEIMMNVGSFLSKPFMEAKKKDLINALFQMENNGFSEGTKAKYRSTIKRFWKWLKDSREYPEEVAWIKTNKVNTYIEDILTKEEINAMIFSGENIMEKAIVAILYESGCRPSEFLNLRIKDISFDKYGALITINSKKTGQRRIRVVKYASLLKKWIEEHPLGSNPSSALWIGQAKKNRNKPMSYYSFRKTLKKIAKKSGVKKNISSYIFRHTRATELAKHLTESQLSLFFGWVQGSEMPQVYVHLSGRDIDEAILRLNGITFNSKRFKCNC